VISAQRAFELLLIVIKSSRRSKLLTPGIANSCMAKGWPSAALGWRKLVGSLETGRSKITLIAFGFGVD